MEIAYVLVQCKMAHEMEVLKQLLEIDLEGPQEGEVLVEIKATGICHTDAYTLSGHYNSRFWSFDR